MTTTPTPEELKKALDAYCHAKDCHLCDGSMLTVGCAIDFMHGVLTGKIGLNGKPIKREPVKPALPKWCKVGAWVTRRDRLAPEQIEDIVDGYIFTTGSRGDAGFFRPVRFRFPTFEEAKEWLGKVLSNYHHHELVYIVYESSDDDAPGGKMVYINSIRADDLHGYTIDGHPFGVPEIDTDAEREAAE